MLELFYDMLRERQRPEDVEPLHVVVDERGLHIVRGHRRGLVLSMLQGVWRHRTVVAPCLLYDAKDPVVARQFSDMDTAVDGLGLHLHGRHSEAYHRGKPLFRTSQEWCDSMVDLPVQESCQSPEARPTRFNKSDRPNCQRSAHLSTQAAANPSDPGSLGQDLAKCHRERDPPAIAAPALLENRTRKGPSAGPGELKEGTVVCVTKRNGSRVSGEVVKISQHDHDSVRVRYCDTDQAGQLKKDWFSVQQLQVPDFSQIKLGMQATAVETETGKHFDCQVLEVSVDKSRAHAPVRVHYTGFSTDDDEWIGADRLRSKLLMFHDAILSAKTMKGAHSDVEECQRASTAKARGSNGCDDESGTESQDLDSSGPKFVCCMWLEGKCWHKGQHFLGKRLYLHEDIPALPCGFGTSCNYKHYETRKGPSAGPGELKEGTVVCVTKRNGSRVSGEVVKISQHDHDSVRVRYCDTDQAGQLKKDWFSVQQLQVPDFSQIKLGMQATAVETETGKNFDCQVLEVSVDKSRAHAPVRVHYTGFSTDDDEWIGADRLRSKLLMFHDAILSAKTMKGAHSDVEECQRASTAKARGSNGCDDESGTESQDLDSSGPKFVCCMWLEGKCWHKGQHFLGKRLYLHEDIPALPCGFGTSCNYKHYETRKGPSAGPGELKEGTVVCVTKRNGSRVSGEVVKISQHDHDSVRVRYCDTDQAGQLKKDWFSVQQLQVPDFSQIKLGMQATAVETETGKHFDCQVLEVSVDKSRAHAPVRVHYTGFSTDDDEWIGADRLRSKLLMFHDAILSAKTMKGAHSDVEECQRASTAKARGSNGCDDESGTESQDLDSSGPKFVCCMWLEGKCWHKGQHFLGKRLYLHEDIPALPCGFGTSCNYKHYETRKGPSAGPGELKEGTVVCVTKRNGSRVSGEVVKISQHDHDSVRVRYCDTDQAGQLKKDWFSVQQLQVPDFSQIKLGMQATAVETETGKNFDCQVLEVSVDKSRAHAPVRVHYTGFSTDDDEWIGADRLRSKLLMFHDAILSAKTMKGAHSDVEECHAGSRTTCMFGLAGEEAPGTPGQGRSAQSSRDEVQRRSVALDLVSTAAIADLPDASDSNAMPWHEPDSEAHAFDHALRATEEALGRQAHAEEWQSKLERTLADVETEGLRGVLEKHGWSGWELTKLVFLLSTALVLESERAVKLPQA